MQSDKMKAIYKVTDTHIHGFFDKHRFLSNFHVHPVLYDGIIYPSNENAYQASKLDPSMFQPKGITKLDFVHWEPSTAKSKGREARLRKDWHNELPRELQVSDSQGPLLVQIRDRVMYEINVMKFAGPKELRDLLLETGDLMLEETNWWKDDYWGVCNGEGLNKLGRILMKIREHYKG